MSKELQPPILPVSLVRIELPTVIKNEPPESEIVEFGIDDILDSSEKEIISDVKDIDIVYHPVCEEYIKSEILESKYFESVETQVLVKAENSLFIQADNITQRNKTGDTSNENVSKGTGQAVVEVQDSNEYSNVLGNLESDAQLVLNFSKDLNGIIGTRSRKAKEPEKTDFVNCYKTVENTSWEKDKEKIKVIKTPVIPIQAYEYISLAKDRHVCNYCQYACNRLDNVKFHIKKMHRKVTTMYQCPYCPYKSKWNLQKHIIQKHKDTKDIQWFQCNLCEVKFKLKGPLIRHMKKVHLKHKQMQDELDLCEKRCNLCEMKFKLKGDLTRHMKVHLRHKQMKDGLDLREKRYGCNECDYETYNNTNFNRHKLVHLKPEEIEYFYCYHCSHKSKVKSDLKKHIFRQHFKNVTQGKRHHCNKCNYRTDESSDLKKHKLIHLKPEEIQYFYCYHCSCKIKRKWDLKKHIFIHFKKEQVKFDCYICNFMTPKRESIIKHIKKHSKVQNKSEIKEPEPLKRVCDLQKENLHLKELLQKERPEAKSEIVK